MTLKERFQSASLIQKIILILVLLILLVLIVLLIYILISKITPAPSTSPADNVNKNINSQLPTNGALPLINNQISSTYLSPESVEQEKIIQQREQSVLLVGTSFVERFGSFSNQTDFANFTDLSIFMTDSMKEYIESYIAKSRQEHPATQEYYGMETKVISSNVTVLDETAGQAEILFTTQRQEFIGTNLIPRVFYQDILIKLIKQNDQWLVNGAYWQ